MNCSYRIFCLDSQTVTELNMQNETADNGDYCRPKGLIKIACAQVMSRQPTRIYCDGCSTKVSLDSPFTALTIQVYSHHAPGL